MKPEELSQKAANGMGQQKGIMKYKLDGKQAINKGENTARKDRSGESRNISKDGNWTLKKCELTRGQEQRTDKRKVPTQQREEYVVKAANRQVEKRLQSQQLKEKMVFRQSGKYESIVTSQGFVVNAKQCQVRGDYTKEEDNDIECLPSEMNIAEGKLSAYNLRNRGEKITETFRESRRFW